MYSPYIQPLVLLNQETQMDQINKSYIFNCIIKYDADKYDLDQEKRDKINAA